MANDCLVTKLKASVNNDALPKLGELAVNVKYTEYPTETSQRVNVGFNSAMYSTNTYDLRIIGDGYFSNTYGGESIGKTVTLSASKQFVYLSNGNYTLIVGNKYKIKSLSGGLFRSISEMDFLNLPSLQFVDVSSQSALTNGHLAFKDVKFDFNKLPVKLWYLNAAYCRNIVLDFNKTLPFNTINLGNLTLTSSPTGNISNLAPYTSLTTLSINNANITGDISSLGTLNKANVIRLNGCIGVQGTIEGLCEGLFTVKTSDSVSVDVQGTQVTLNGTTHGAYLYYCTFNGSTVTVKQGGASGALLATYDGSSWTYN